jgi:hypothetical protein
MTVFPKGPHSWRRAAWLAALVVVLSTMWVTADRAQTRNDTQAKTTTFTPYALLQYSTLTGTGNTITATWVPVVTSTGTVYQNVTLEFTVESNGTLKVAGGYPKVVATPPVVVSSFEAGNYQGPSTVLGGLALISVSNPGITSGGSTEWSLASSSGASGYTYPNTATWYVGPMSSSPLLTRLTNAGITATQYSDYGGWGVSSGQDYWGTNALTAFSQTGNSLTILSFTPYDSSTDSSEPVSQITYTLIPPP